jgi:hypothetical protein
MKMKIIWIICALISFGITIPLSITFYNDYEVYTKGNLINVTITNVPKIYGGPSSFNFMNFNYNDKNYSIKVYNTNGFSIGENIQLRYLKGFENHFLFPDDNPLGWDIFAIIILVVTGIGCIYYLFKD